MVWSAETPDGKAIIVAGADKIGESVIGKVWKINSADGSVIWEMPYDPSPNHEEEFETVFFTSDGGAIIGGAVDIPKGTGIGFKSTGIMMEGKPFVAKLKASDVNGSKAPKSFEWTYTEPDIMYRGGTKSVRIDGEDTIYASVGRESAIIQIDGVTG